MGSKAFWNGWLAYSGGGMEHGKVFKCPLCGDSKFGTSGNTGYCHGYTIKDGARMSCRFTWTRDNDASVFVKESKRGK